MRRTSDHRFVNLPQTDYYRIAHKKIRITYRRRFGNLYSGNEYQNITQD